MPPDDLPTYRLLTGEEDATFCHRVSDALALGYRLHGSPVMTSVDARVIVGHALVWPSSTGDEPSP
jgi:hypothetical protein